MIKKIIDNFKVKKLVEARKKELSQDGNKTSAEALAMDSCKWVDLYWNGTKRPFLIHKINFQELLMCGRFPNILYKFVEGISDVLNEEKTEKSSVNLQQMKEEEDEFRHELAEKSMVEPKYRECYDAIVNLLANPEANRNDVIPQDFLDDLFLWYLTEWEIQIKKKSELLISKGLGESQNTGEKPQVNTSQG